MFTWQHGFWIYFLTRQHVKVWQFVAGAMLPDYIYIVAIGMMFMRGQMSVTDVIAMKPTMIMSLLPLYPWVVKIDLIGHSIVIWGIAFLLALLPVIKKGQALIIGWGTHLLMDSLTHGAYANYFLYPMSLLSVHSPVSYWEPQYFAHEFRIVNNSLMIIAASYLTYHWWKKKQQK